MKNIGGKYMQYLWIVLLVLSALLEGLWTKGVFLCFVPASLVAMFLAFFRLDAWIQVGMFLLLAGLSLIFLRPLVRGIVNARQEAPFSVESAIGMRTVVVERLDNVAGRGAITLDGMEWAARTLSDDIVIEGLDE